MEYTYFCEMKLTHHKHLFQCFDISNQFIPLWFEHQHSYYVWRLVCSVLYSAYVEV